MIHYLRKQLLIQRLAGVPKLRSYNLVEHAYFVAVLFLDLCKSEQIPVSANAMDLVMKHDFLEVITTDLPYPVKNLNETTKKAWETIEHEALHAFKFGPQACIYKDENIKETLGEAAWEIFKIADMLELWIFCQEDRALGNNSLQMTRVWELTLEYLESWFSKHPRLEEIIRELWPSYLAAAVGVDNGTFVGMHPLGRGKMEMGETT